MSERIDPVIVLAVVVANHTPYRPAGGWRYAEEVRGAMKQLGHDLSSAKVAGRLTAMCKMDAPPFERQRNPWGGWEYRVTGFGRTWLSNLFPAVESEIGLPGFLSKDKTT